MTQEFGPPLRRATPASTSGAEPPPADQAPTAQIPATSAPLRLCPRCSTESRTAGEFCPQCGARFAQPGLIPAAARPARLIALTLVGLLVAAGAVAAFLWIQHANHRAAAQRHQTQVRAQQQAAARSQQLARRRQILGQLERSVAAKAGRDVAQGLIVGPITRTVCTPRGGANPADLTQRTGSFECIAVNKDNPDGSYEGYRFIATVNYDSGRYKSRLTG
jgi:hypothetical protein